MNKDVLKYVRQNILALTPYSTARDEFKGGSISVWLDANESPYDTGFNRYPDPHQKELKERIATVKGVKAENIFIGGSGSDEAIDLVYRVFCEPKVDNVVAIDPSYGVYAVAAAINDIELRQVALGEEFSLPVADLLKAADANTKVMWICSPNNPTANAFERQQILDLADAFDGIVVVDEAYVDFSQKGSLLDAIVSHPNLIVLQTFSKAWGLASLRVGMAFATKEIADIFGRVKYPYNVSGPTQKEIMRQLDRDISKDVAEIIDQRCLLAEAMTAMPFVRRVHPSDANFLLVRVDDPNGLYQYLVDNGVIVRNRCRMTACQGALRITVGTPKENALLIQLLNSYANAQ
jgi:histidinol-phosphate aminotransferase